MCLLVLWSGSVECKVCRLPMVLIKLTKVDILGLPVFTNFVSFAFANESIYGKSVSVVRASTYGRYFGQKLRYPIKCVRVNRFGGYPATDTRMHMREHTRKLLKQSADDASGFITHNFIHQSMADTKYI